MIANVRYRLRTIAESVRARLERLRSSVPASAPARSPAGHLPPPAPALRPWPIETLKADTSAGSYLIRKAVLDFYARAERKADRSLPAGLNSVVMQRRYGFA